MLRRHSALHPLASCILLVALELSAGCASPGERQQEIDAIASTSRDAGAADNQLRELRIDPRGLGESELAGALCIRFSSLGDAVDPAVGVGQPLAPGSSLPLEHVRPVLDSYRAAFKKPRIDPATGGQALDATTGEPLFEDRDTEIRTCLAGALRRFRGSGRSGALDPIEFRRYIENTAAESVPLEHMVAMQRFFGQLHLLGLGPREEESCRHTNMGRVCPSGLRVQQLDEAIMAPPAETLF